MFCKKCGNNLSEEARFCGRCGEAVKVKVEEASFTYKVQKQESQVSEDFPYHKDIKKEHTINENKIKENIINENTIYENTSPQETTSKQKKSKKISGKLVAYILIMLLVAGLGVYLSFGEELIPKIKSAFASGKGSLADEETGKPKEDTSNNESDKTNSKTDTSDKANNPPKVNLAEERKAQYDLLLSLVQQESDRAFKGIKGSYSLAFKDLSMDKYLSINNRSNVAASVITIYIMIEAFRQVEYGGISLSSQLALTEWIKVGGTGVIRNEKAGTLFTIEELIYLMIAKSDNTATNMLIDFLGMDNINNTIASLGCRDTVLNRYMMDQAAIEWGYENYTSVNDLCMTLEKIYRGQCISKSADAKMINMLKRNETDTKITAQLPLTVEVANKTGELKGVENDCGIIFTANGAYVLCILTSDGTVGEQRSCISYLSKYVYDKYMAY